MTGEATRMAAVRLRAKAIAAAADLLQIAPEALDVIDGKVVRKNAAQGPSVTLGEVARALNPGSKLLGEAMPGLAAEGFFESRHMNYPYGIHFAVVRVDRDTGAVAVERFFVAYDIGKAVNPMLVDGQIAGGVAQGIGGALFEEFLYDARGEPLCVNFADYVMPTAREVPPIEVLITEDAPSPLNALGVKGAGEGGANAVGAAIAAAIDDALGRPGAVTQLPVTPQRLRQEFRRPYPALDRSELHALDLPRNRAELARRINLCLDAAAGILLHRGGETFQPFVLRVVDRGGAQLHDDGIGGLGAGGRMAMSIDAVANRTTAPII